MKWKLTGRYLVSVVLIVIFVIIINIMVVIVYFIIQSVNQNNLVHQKETSAESITRSFQKYIVSLPSGVSITDTGKEELDANQAWIQVLDENGRQVYGYHVPEGAKLKYTPLDIVQMYKYFEVGVESTVFIGEKTVQDHQYSYFVGFKSPFLERQVLTFDRRSVAKLFKIVSLTLIIIDGFIALCIAYLFSKRLTKPLHLLIDSIKRLANKNYNQHETPKGVYKEVFHNVNLLSEELKAGENERRKLDRMREEWISNISHDIKTPLASIQGYAEMLKNKDYQLTGDEIREYAEIIERKSIYLKDVIEDLNLSTRLKSKELKLHKKNVNLVSLVRSIVIDTLNDSRYSNRNITFSYGDDVIQAEVDEILIRRAISNLIYNAIVHNDEHVVILVSVEKVKGHTLIRVEDNGKGIKQKEIDRVFDRYFRGTNTGELHKGSGLGMAIAHDVVKAHDGDIQIQSQEGKGTKIIIRL